MKDFIGKEINGLDQMNVDYRTNLEVTEGKGGEFRRIKVEMTFVDAFDKK